MYTINDELGNKMDFNQDNNIIISDNSTINTIKGTKTNETDNIIYSADVSQNSKTVNYGKNVTITGSSNSWAGIYNYGQNASISPISSYYSIINYDTASNSTINGKNDIYNYADNVIMNQNGSANYLKLENGKLVYGENNESRSISGGINVTINGGKGIDCITNYGDYALINAGSGNDRISNEGNNTTILGGNDNNFIGNYGASNVLIKSDNGNDDINNYGQYYESVDNLTIGSNITIDSGAGNDQILNGNYKVSINAGADDDYI